MKPCPLLLLKQTIPSRAEQYLRGPEEPDTPYTGTLLSRQEWEKKFGKVKHEEVDDKDNRGVEGEERESRDGK